MEVQLFLMMKTNRMYLKVMLLISMATLICWLLNKEMVPLKL